MSVFKIYSTSAWNTHPDTQVPNLLEKVHPMILTKTGRLRWVSASTPCRTCGQSANATQCIV